VSSSLEYEILLKKSYQLQFSALENLYQKWHVQVRTLSSPRLNVALLCIAVEHCFPDILGVMVLEDINLFEDEVWRPPLWSNETDLDFCQQSPTYKLSAVFISTTHKFHNYVH
jgi:hypothetical protein